MPENSAPIRRVTHQFLVEVRVDPDDPKLVSIEEIRLRVADGPQWMDGVIAVDTRYCGIRPYEVE